MSLFCKHDWKVLGKTIAEPKNPPMVSFNRDEYEKNRVGYVNYLLSCKLCGAVQEHTLIGKDGKK